MNDIRQIVDLFRERGGSEYGGEPVTQLEHALQAATLAELGRAAPELIVAALLHDVGHLLHDLPADAPDAGIDDHHENAAANWLSQFFPDGVTEPIRLHVAAKRFLCTTELGYESALSDASLVSLRLQGGRMTEDEVAHFKRNPHAAGAMLLRRWDDAAKVPGLATPALEHFAAYCEQVSLRDRPL